MFKSPSGASKNTLPGLGKERGLLLLKEIGLLHNLNSHLDTGLTLTSPFSTAMAAPRPGLGCGCHHVAKPVPKVMFVTKVPCWRADICWGQ